MKVYTGISGSKSQQNYHWFYSGSAGIYRQKHVLSYIINGARHGGVRRHNRSYGGLYAYSGSIACWGIFACQGDIGYKYSMHVARLKQNGISLSKSYIHGL